MTDLVAFWYAKDYLINKIEKLEKVYKTMSYSEFGTLKPLQIKQEIEITKNELNYVNNRIKDLENERKQYNEWRDNYVDTETGEITYFKKEEM